MFTDDQRQYIEEVLGHRLMGDAAPAKAQDLLVLTPPLDEEQRALLTKILGSIQINHYQHRESEQIEVGTDLQATNVLAFTEGQSGPQAHGWWILPPLTQMIGANAEVVARKKEAWNWLQQFAKGRT